MKRDSHSVTACHCCEFDGKGAIIEAFFTPSMLKHKGMRKAKGDILAYLSTHCTNCRRTSQDDIRIKKSPKNVRPDLTVSTSTAGSAPCTDLPESVENTLRTLLKTVTSMDALDVLLILHVCEGGAPNTFGPWLNREFEVARTYGAVLSRATAKAKWDAICKKFAPFNKLRSWGIGHGGRKSLHDDDVETEHLTQGELGL